MLFKNITKIFTYYLHIKHSGEAYLNFSDILSDSPVDGIWSEWQTISPGRCTVSCGGGVRQTVLERPKYGGSDCQGNRMIKLKHASLVRYNLSQF